LDLLKRWLSKITVLAHQRRWQQAMVGALALIVVGISLYFLTGSGTQTTPTASTSLKTASGDASISAKRSVAASKSPVSATHPAPTASVPQSATPLALQANAATAGFQPLLGAFVGAQTASTPNVSIYTTAQTTAQQMVPNRAAGLDMISDIGTGANTWHSIVDLTAWKSDTSDAGGNSNIGGDKEFINSRSGRAVVMTLHMVPANLDSPITINGITASTCPQDPSASASAYNDDYVCMMAGATGQFNNYWKTLSQNLVNYGLGNPNLILRIGWECSGNWMPWSAYVAGEANYAAYYKNIVTAMRSVPGADFKFAWNCGTGKDLGDSSHADHNYADVAYPGDAYVDYLDFDPYSNGNGGLSNTTNDWDAITVNGDHGLAWWVNFAAQNNKYLGFSEWGTATDNPTYIQEVYNFMYTNNGSNFTNRVAYANYFQTATTPQDNPSSQDFKITDHPSSYALYKLLFGATPAGTLP
jgi:hypothetical protein